MLVTRINVLSLSSAGEEEPVLRAEDQSLPDESEHNKEEWMNSRYDGEQERNRDGNEDNDRSMEEPNLHIHHSEDSEQSDHHG